MSRRIFLLFISLLVSSYTSQAQTIPIVYETQKITESNNNGVSVFGSAISNFENFAIIGAEYYNSSQGSAYIFEKIDGVWVEQQQFLPYTNTDELFGCSVDISDNHAIIGARRANFNSGYIYFLKKDGASWIINSGYYSNPEPEEWDMFGLSVSISGNNAIVGVPGDDYEYWNDDFGSAFIYSYNGSTWSPQTELTASDAGYHYLFGGSVSIFENYAIVGSSGSGENGNNAGAAYVFKYNGTGWVEQTKLTASDGLPYDSFGHAVSINNNYAFVSPFKNDEIGSVYIYHRDGEIWSEQEIITASDSSIGDHFGRSVDIYNDILVVGATSNDYNGDQSGSAYVYKYNGTTWDEIAKLVASDGAPLDWLGCAVSIYNEDIIVGAKGDDNASGWASGAAYIFGPASTLNINENLESVFNIYPNPNNGYFLIENAKNYSLKIIDFKGKIIKKMAIKDNKTRIDLQFKLSKGIYILNLTSDKNSYTTKLIIE